MSAITWDREPVLQMPVRTARQATATAGLPSEHAHLRLTGRGRAVVWALAVAVAGGVGLSAQSADADAPAAAVRLVTHVVAPGETLWQIAGTVAAPGEDLRDVVSQLVELNGLGDAGLQSGQEILVPVG